MARPALSTFAAGVDASRWLIFVGATTSSPLGQVRTFEWTVDKTIEEQQRVGDSKIYRRATGLNVTMSLQLWRDGSTASELKQFRTQGNTVTPGATNLIAQEYDGEGTASALRNTYTFANWDVTSTKAGPRESGSLTYDEFDLTADSVTES